MKTFQRGLFFLGLASAVAAACTSFGTADTPESDATAPSSVPDSAVPPADASAVDAIAVPPEAGCARAPKGVANACVGCSGVPFYTPTLADAGAPDSGITGPHIFGVVTDGTSVFWLEQTGINSYNGVAAATVVKRKKLAGGSPAETVLAMNGGFTRLVVNGGSLWIASHSQQQPIRVIEKDCGPAARACAPQDSAVVEPISAIVAFNAGVAVAIPNGRQLLTFPSPGSAPAPTTVPHPISGLAEWKSKLAVVAESPETAKVVTLYPGGATLPLATDPGTPVLFSAGANMLASTCDDLWAYQVFKPTDGGSAHTALVNAASASPRGIPIDALTFAIGADTTHVYAGLPNGFGLRRAARNGTNASEIIGSASVFSLAITDDLVIYDDHGRGGSARSVGIFTMKKSN